MNPFKLAYCAELVENLSTEAGIEKYNSVEFTPDATKVLEDVLPVNGEPPILNPDNDLESAIAVHKYLSEFDELTASDKRPWTTLTHTTFRKYVMERWPIKTDDSAAKRNAILRRWFAEGGSDRTLENNAIARLWWGAHLTYAPWKTNPDMFSHLENENEYYLTKRLFSLQELIKVTMESSLGRSNKFLVVFLSFLDSNPQYVNNEDVGALMKEFNLLAGASKILIHSPEVLESMLQKSAVTLIKK